MCYEGGSPYELETYRYPAAIACTLFYPQQHFAIPEFGKVIFSHFVSLSHDSVSCAWSYCRRT